MSLLDYAPLDEINEDYGDHDGLIAIDEDDYNHDGLVDLNNDNNCLVDPDNDNDCLIRLNRDGLVGFECDDLVGVLVSDLSDSEEIGGMPSLPENVAGKSYPSYTDYVQARRSRTAGIFANSGMLAARSAIAEERTAAGPRRAKNPRDDLAMPPLLPRRKSSRRIVSEDIDLAATMQSSSPGDLCVNITDGSLLITTRRSSPLSRLGGKDGSSPSGSLLVSSGTDSDTAHSFAATFAPRQRRR